MGIHPETGKRPFPDFFSGHWSRNRVGHMSLFSSVSGFRTAATLWSSGIRILVPNWVKQDETKHQYYIEQKEFLKVLFAFCVA
jgi:hypothetical protein